MNKRFSKFMLTSASALALLAAYPSVASTAEVVGLDLPAITAEAATQGNAFIRVVRALPSVANITSADAASVRAARNLYNSLPNAEKANADVTRWAGYLADKEAALPVDHVANFIAESRALPHVREINAMDASEFAKAKVDLQAARSSYAKLTDAQKARTDVARWAGYLTVKEDAFGVTFILAAKDLPSMDAIGKMDAKELVVVQEDIDSVRELYDALSDVAKADKEVARWIGYVDQKEEAAKGEDVVVDLEEVKATKTAEIKAVVLSQEDTAGKTEESIALAEAKLKELKETALKAVEAAETEEEVEAVKVDTADALALLEDVVEDEELVVESVSAINKSGVTVKFPALTEAMTDVTVEVKDNTGKVVEVTPKAVLDVGETTATFTFKTALTAEPTGTWKVNGVAFDANAQAAVKAVKDAKNQVELLNALKSSYFTGVNADLIAHYFGDADRGNVGTVKDVQDIINKVNKANAGTQAAKKVTEAKNQVELLKALQEGGFEGVNPSLISAYEAKETEAGTKDYTKADTVAKVQALIDSVNLKAAQDSVTAATDTEGTALKTEEIDKAQALVNALPSETTAEKSTKKGLQDRIDKANALVKVKNATTQASLLAALKSPVLGLTDIKDDLAKDYKAKLDTVKDDIKTNEYTLQSLLVNKVNESFGSFKVEDATVHASATAKPTFIIKALRKDGKAFSASGGTAPSPVKVTIGGVTESITITDTFDDEKIEVTSSTGFDLQTIGTVVEPVIEFNTNIDGTAKDYKLKGKLEVTAAADATNTVATMKLDKTDGKYVSGENVTLTFTLKDASKATITTENGTYAAAIKLGKTNGDTVYKNITFVNGKATVTVPARKALSSAEKVEIKVTPKSAAEELTLESTATIAIEAGEFSKLDVAQNETTKSQIDLKATDGINTVTDYKGNKLVNIKAVKVVTVNNVTTETPVPVAGVDYAGNVTKGFTSGAANHNTSLGEGTYKITVTVDGISTTETIVIPGT